MKKILLSLLTVGTVAVVALTATTAFFSDTETSVDNTFIAGAIDLLIDNTSYAIDWNIPGYQNPQGEFVLNRETSWRLANLTVERFFDFIDLKPGDYGEDTISVHVNNNDAWVCAAARITDDNDNTYNEPELADDPTIGADPSLEDGELDEEVNFAFWRDDGDNVYEDGEQIFLQGPLSGLGEEGQIALADSSTGTPIPGGETVYIGKYWCFGDLEPNPDSQDGFGNQKSPLDATGFTCDGTDINNSAQTDIVVGDIQFYAEQHRNNPGFLCSQWNPDWPDGEQRQVVGSTLGRYSEPSNCDFTVDNSGSYQTIAAALAAASDGDTICVDPTYTGGDTFPVSVSVPNVTIAGLGSAGDANVPGGLFVEQSGVTITGLEFTGYTFIQASANAAIYIHNEELTSGVPLSNTTIRSNIFTAPGGAKAAEAKAIITEIGSGASTVATGIDVRNNVFNGWRQAMFFNTAADYEVAYNDILNNDVGVANDGPDSASIHNNDFEDNVLEAVGVAPAANNGTGNNGVLTVNFNNLFPAGVGNDVNWYGPSVSGGADVNAENNWWDGEAEAARTNDTGEVDTDPAEVAAFPEN